MTGPARLVVTCPHCGHVMDEHDCVGSPGAIPEDGDVTLCWRCRAPSSYARSALGVLALRPLTPVEELEVMRDPRITAALAAAGTTWDPRRAARRANATLRRRGGDR